MGWQLIETEKNFKIFSVAGSQTDTRKATRGGEKRYGMG